MAAYFGLDIGSTSIKVIQSDGARIRVLGIAVNPFGKNISLMSNSEKISLTDSIRLLLKDCGMKANKVICSIPESLVFSKVLKFPVMSNPELSTAIKWELDQSVPFPPNEIETSWVVLDKPDKVVGDEKISVYVVAVPTNISDAYVQILELIGLVPERIENEIPSLCRSFESSLSDSSPSIICDMGSSGTSIVVAGKTKIFSNYYVPVGGSAMTRLISDAFSLPIDQSEGYKRTYGMSSDQLEGKMVLVLKPVVDNLLGEIRKMIISYRDSYTDSSINKLILTGGGSYLVGLIPYLSQYLEGVEIVMGDAFSDLAVEEKYKGLGPVFAVAYGLSI
jgi:type IV pilus assembly protein PilM